MRIVVAVLCSSQSNTVGSPREVHEYGDQQAERADVGQVSSDAHAMDGSLMVHLGDFHRSVCCDLPPFFLQIFPLFPSLSSPLIAASRKSSNEKGGSCRVMGMRVIDDSLTPLVFSPICELSPLFSSLKGVTF